eukprot:7016982-Pyramimonas_sp.AAC.1
MSTRPSSSQQDKSRVEPLTDNWALMTGYLFDNSANPEPKCMRLETWGSLPSECHAMINERAQSIRTPAKRITRPIGKGEHDRHLRGLRM